MKYIFIVIVIAFLSPDIDGQNLIVKEIKRKPNPKFYNTGETTIIYPLISTNNKKVDDLINFHIKNDIFSPDNEKEDVNKILIEYLNDYALINLSYEITYKQDGLLSINIFYEGCGAYCSSNTTYFNFDLKTGEKIELRIFYKSIK